MKTLTSTIVCGAFAAALSLGTLAATAMPVSPDTAKIAAPAAAVQPEKVYWCRWHRCYRRYGYYRRYYYRPYYGYYRPYVGVRVPFLHFGIY